MTHTDSTPRFAGNLAAVAGLLLAASLAGCAAPKSGYGLAADRQPPPEPQAGALTPANTRSTYLDLVRQMQDKGLWFASLAHVDALEKQWGVTPETTLLRADALRMTAQLAAAAALYASLDGTPAAAAAHRGLGLLAAAGGDYAGAVRSLEQAQKLAPTDAALLSDLGYAYLRARRVADARIPVMQAAQLSPREPRVLANLALFLLADGQPAQAEAVMGGERVPAPMRLAILREAASLRGEAVPGEAAGAQTAAAPAAGVDGPLALKPASWSSWQGTARDATRRLTSN